MAGEGATDPEYSAASAAPIPDVTTPEPATADPAPDAAAPASFASDHETPRGPDGGASAMLTNLLSRRPFLDLYERTADYPRLHGRLRWSFIAEFFVRILVVAGLIAIAVGVAWKTLAPFPPW